MGCERIAGGILYGVCYDERVLSMLIESIVGFRVGGIFGRVPGHLIYGNCVAGLLQSGFGRGDVIERDEEDAVAEGGGVDRAGKRNPDSRADVEAIELIDEPEAGAQRGLGCAVR
jgi:hypothetical protein